MEIQSGVRLSEHTWWKIGGPAEFFCQPETIEDVRSALAWAAARALPVTVLGGGTNVLVGDLGIPGLTLHLKRFIGLDVNETPERLELVALAGTPKGELTKQFLKRRLAPALFLCGLPGDVGGGLVMNAGVAEAITPREFHELVDWMDVMAMDGTVARFTKAQLEWAYRHSGGWQPGVVVRAGLSWPIAPDAAIPQKVKDATRTRLAKQPLNLPSCGSTFKNPLPRTAGALIDQAGLKGYTVGGAQVSPKHANFIVNLGGATASDVRQVMAHVQNEVRRQFGVELETEVRFLGRFA